MRGVLRLPYFFNLILNNKMFPLAQKMLGIVTIKDENGIITVSGVNGKQLGNALRAILKTSRVGNNLLITSNYSSFSLYSFFLPELLFVINTLLKRNTPFVGRRTLLKLQDKLTTETWVKHVFKEVKSKLDYAQLKRFTLSPLDFQSEFFEKYDTLTQQYGLNGFLFAGAAGSGKTYSSLALAFCLKPKKIIIICPKNAVNQVWEETIRNKIKEKIDYAISSTHTGVTGKEFIQIFHYEDLKKVFQLTSHRDKDVVIILDESHNFNELTSDRTQLFITFCNEIQCRNVIWLSGTPIKALSREAIPLLRTIDPLFTPDVEQVFRAMFKNGTEESMEVLSHRLGIISFIVPKERLKLSDPILTNVGLVTPNANRFTLDEIRKDMVLFVKERKTYWKIRLQKERPLFFKILANFKDTLRFEEQPAFENYLRIVHLLEQTTDYRGVQNYIVQANQYENTVILPRLGQADKLVFKELKSAIKYLPLKIKGECLGVVVDGARRKCFSEIATNIDFEYYCDLAEKKTLVFTSYVDVIKAANTKCQEDGLTPVLVYGGTNKNLSKLIDEFQTDDALNPIIATYDSLSTAVPLTMCSSVLLINVPYRDYELQQSISRAHRLGNDAQIYVYGFYLDTGTKPNISTRAVDILSWSQEEIEKIINIKSPYILSNGDNDSGYVTETLVSSIEGPASKNNIIFNW